MVLLYLLDGAVHPGLRCGRGDRRNDKPRQYQDQGNDRTNNRELDDETDDASPRQFNVHDPHFHGRFGGQFRRFAHAFQITQHPA